MFMLAPRIHFCGYYYCKEKYIKFGEKSMSQTFTPLNDNNSQYNNSGQPLIEKENNQGEFIIKDDMVYVRYNRAQTIFQYNMRIRGSSVGAHDMLMVENYSMYQIDLNYTYNIYSSNADDSSKVYKYKPLQQIKDDIDEKKYRKIKYMSL
ncbi:hypothetical protein IMG5_058930 [Ichthyophthirius multifiliis]|uniref:Uncharacterized protein n=1 Tax=Ichthyophthirius multifiliis TaxID=5932 RepID=G0QNI3_ICHMU|nr:hypothetical protein IMG5_058930 [Ichthyophthirius multifiliis]EGR33217.1 hypothetical protein IMG5_058930 [Ichthyophthirius multifiliis]|eukprot:XP_004037203.1 hypothetical protein IMG5_058930 [Ichthyophthirius multifiliis]